MASLNMALVSREMGGCRDERMCIAIEAPETMTETTTTTTTVIETDTSIQDTAHLKLAETVKSVVVSNVSYV